MAKTIKPPPTKYGPPAGLQAKPADAARHKPIAPPPTKYGPGTAAQRKAAPPPPTRWAAVSAAPRRTMQPALERKPFSSTTQKTVTLTAGQHRRHIIPHHLMKAALGAWMAAHPGVMSQSELQGLLDRMNNHIPNLHPGEGVQNSAMGMVSTWGASRLDQLDVDMVDATEISDVFAKPRGFFQGRQIDMLEPVIAPIESDMHLSSSPPAAFTYARDIVTSTDFDWPGGTSGEYEAWESAYLDLKRLRDGAQFYTKSAMLKVCEDFLRLTAPSGRHD